MRHPIVAERLMYDRVHLTARRLGLTEISDSLICAIPSLPSGAMYFDGSLVTPPERDCRVVVDAYGDDGQVPEDDRGHEGLER